jgi:hypothetical protein
MLFYEPNIRGALTNVKQLSCVRNHFSKVMP